MLDHGGNLDVACQRFGGRVEDWIDLSTGINRQPYPIGALPQRSWTALPSRAEIEALHEAARQAYATKAPLLAVAGAQAAIQMLPQLAPPGRACVLAPTYNEYAPVLVSAGWQVEEADDLDALAGADLAVVVNPNNPDGREYDPKALLTLASRVKRLVVDESFADAAPDVSLAAEAGRPGFLILRSFGKFYGLAGLRLGFVLGGADVAALAAMAGPWPISGAAIEIGRRALLDRDWADATRARLSRDAERLDALVLTAGWQLNGGTPLFRLYETGDAVAAQKQLARAKIWSRVFSGKPGWLRLGLPGDEPEWQRLASALSAR
ncbi:MAG TPA: threonine-phosphate decarboxylase CobD [Bradyrhizobium sp.]|uniref:threonine-phosphate decarboxylase CobD n=1 Tax=Bradyrhizobium sp. TaxID=376 RepID=UPI002BBBC57E|nr:threonine-phosphate decarboxylase CobD [Bradyrhizobium sp.]HLZ06017.1 threonine-phosphate decarboxylase CobD [Bradyrhizobium sp.]